MTYLEKLQSELWVAKRYWILRRDKYQCQHCFKPALGNAVKPISLIRGGVKLKTLSAKHLVFIDKVELQVHHKFYIIGKEPWDYDDEHLITLCPDCHKKEHETTVIEVRHPNGEKLVEARNCPKCGGSGYLPEFNHVEGGICFLCYGEGIYLDDIVEKLG